MVSLTQANYFGISFSKIKDLVITTQEVNVPGFSINHIRKDTPFSTLNLPGTKPEFRPLSFTFKLSDTMIEYKKIMEWMFNIALIEDFQTRADATKQGIQSLYGDCTVIKYNNTGNPILNIKYIDVIPMNISDMNFTSEVTEPQYIDATLTLNYLRFELV